MITEQNGMFPVENGGNAGFGIPASSCIHKSGSDLQGIVNVRSPAIRHVIRHRRFQSANAHTGFHHRALR